MNQPVYFRRFRKLNHRYWMSGLLVGTFIGFTPACKFTGPEGVAGGPQSLYANDVLSSHNGGIEKSGFKIPESLSVPGEYRNLKWMFTRAQAYSLPPINNNQINLTSLTLEDLNRTQDPYYCAMRWDYGTRPEQGMKFFAGRKLIVIAHGQVTRAVVVRVVDWGPAVTSDGGIALSQSTLAALGIAPGNTVGVAFENSDSERTGPVVLGVQ
ncbi:hypothetical protein EBU99_05200 [bacterium]|nr:hypothetical protein [bacterium]